MYSNEKKALNIMFNMDIDQLHRSIMHFDFYALRATQASLAERAIAPPNTIA